MDKRKEVSSSQKIIQFNAKNVKIKSAAFVDKHIMVNLVIAIKLMNWKIGVRKRQVLKQARVQIAQLWQRKMVVVLI